MNTEKIEIALINALSLLSNEVDNIELEELKNEYLSVIEEIEEAINELK